MSYAQFSEDFEGDLSTWTLDSPWVQGTSADLSSDFLDFPDYTTFLAVNDDAAGTGVSSNGMAILPAISIPNSDGVYLLFDYWFRDGDYNGADETAKVLISTDGGSNFVELVNLGAVSSLDVFDSYSLSLADYAGQEVNIAFEYQDGDEWNFGFAIDNVSVFELLPENVTLVSASVANYALLNTDTDITFELFNKGLNNVNSVTLEWTDGTNTYTEEVTGLNVPSLESVTLTHPVPANYASSGLNTIDCSVTLVNGVADNDESDNEYLGLTLELLSQFGTKRVLFEEGTGTWCPWCPRGAVAMDYMFETYPDQFVGVAVHVGDIMQIGDYDPITNLFGGYPGAVIDRSITGASVSQGLFVDYLEDRLTVPAIADISASAVVQDNNISVEVSSVFYKDLDNGSDYRVLVILTEDGVTGTTSDYAQANAYAGGGNGAMGGYENLPNPVPAAQMVYDHVGRAIPTGYNGVAGSIPANVVSGEANVYNVSYAVPAAYVAENMHAVVAIVNTTTNELVNVNSTSVVISSTNELVNAVDMKVFPNPTVSDLSVTFDAEGDYQVFITNLSGKVVAQQNFTGISGKQAVNFDVSNLASGSYVLTIAGENQASSKTVIIK
jgi:hypothetical protein